MDSRAPQIKPIGMERWSECILEVLPADGRALSHADLEVVCSQRLGQLLDRPAFSESIEALLRRKMVQRDATSVWRIQADFDECLLEPATETFLRSEVCLDSLRVALGGFVLEKTTAAGAAGAGRWSRPDFALAAIRRFKYDPRRYLDVYSFELKNRRGADVVAVHEALAHARFSHFAYLVCPRSNLIQAETNIIRQSCTDHGIGLITFDLSASDAGEPVLAEFRFEVSPQRRSPDPAEIDLHLDARLTAHSRERLIAMAGT